MSISIGVVSTGLLKAHRERRRQRGVGYIVVLTTENYLATLTRMVRLNIVGGGSYDGLIAQAALKAKVDILLTLNPKHFPRLGEEVARLVQVPK
jgi:hypothetical protein